MEKTKRIKVWLKWGLAAFFLLDAVLLIWYFLIRRQSTSIDQLKSIRNKNPGSCLVLEQRYCSKAEPVYKDNELLFVGFKLPENTPIFSPFSGNVSTTPSFNLKNNGKSEIYPGASVHSKEKIFAFGADRPKYSFSFIFFNKEDFNKPSSYDVEKGGIVGLLSSKKISVYGDYNLLVYFSEFDLNQKMFVLKQSELENFFSGIND